MSANNHTKTWKVPIAGLVATLIAAAAGCTGPANEYESVVTGTVLVNGELARSGTITFLPQDKQGKIAIGRIYPDGSYSLRTGQGDLRESDGGTVVPGEYLVTFSIHGPSQENTEAPGGPPISGPLLIDDKYTNGEASDLHRTVKPGENIFTFDLKAARPAEEESPESDPDAVSDDEPTSDRDAPAAREPSDNAETTTRSPVEGAPQ
jgi:hypothetical protein